MGRRGRDLGIGLWLVGATVAQAQMPAVGVPKGVLRLETDGLFEAFDEQFHAGQRESYGATLSSPALGSDRIPALADVDSRLNRVTGTSSVRLNLGVLTTDAHADISTAVLGAGFGLSNRITVFARLPLISQRVQSRSRFDSATANAGVIPPPEQQAIFFNQFQAALATLSTKLNAGDYNSNPTRKALAEATLARGTAMREDLLAIFDNPSSDAPFAPIDSSPAGIAVIDAVAALQHTLSTDLSVSGFSDTLVLPSSSLTSAEFGTFVESGLGYRPGQTQLQYRGDAEFGIAYTLVDQWNRGDRYGGFRTALSALVRLPTGLRERPDRLLDLGTGDGQTDIELGIVTDVGGSRWGARMTGTYMRQLPADVTQRVTAPTQPLVGPERLATVHWDPGDVIAVGVRPFYRLTGPIAIQVGVDHWRHGADDVGYARTADSIPGVSASVLATDSKASATTASIGIAYANAGARRTGGRGLPVEASWLFERVMSSGEGIVPVVQRVRASLRLYFQLFK